MPIDVQAFVGSVALAGMQGDLWCVDGGNYRVAEELVQRTGSTFLSASQTEAAKSLNLLMTLPYMMQELPKKEQ